MNTLKWIVRNWKVSLLVFVLVVGTLYFKWYSDKKDAEIYFITKQYSDYRKVSNEKIAKYETEYKEALKQIHIKDSDIEQRDAVIGDLKEQHRKIVTMTTIELRKSKLSYSQVVDEYGKMESRAVLAESLNGAYEKQLEDLNVKLGGALGAIEIADKRFAEYQDRIDRCDKALKALGNAVVKRRSLLDYAIPLAIGVVAGIAWGRK